MKFVHETICVKTSQIRGETLKIDVFKTKFKNSKPFFYECTVVKFINECEPGMAFIKN